MIGLELTKLRRSRRPLLALAACIIFLVLMLLGFYLYAQKQTSGQAEFRYTVENESYFNGLTFTLYAFFFAVQLVLPIFVATEGGAQLAGETGAGTLRMLLVRPVSKSRIFLVKGLTAALYAGLLCGLFLALCLGVGLVAVGWGDLDLYPGLLQMTEVHQHLDQRTALVRFALAWPAATLSLVASLAFGLMLSAFTRSPVNAAATAISLYLVMHVIASVHFFEALRPFLYTSFVDYWRGLFQEQVDWLALARDTAKLGAFTCLFLAAAHWRFRTREEL